MLRSPASLLALTLVLLAGVLAACGGSSSNPMAPTPTTTATPTPTPTATPTPAATATITIQAFTWMPQNLEVAPGTTVTVVNTADNSPHSVTSEATPGAFTPGAVNGVQFDTGGFTGTRTFTIPANAPVGTVIPYYCSVHLSNMVNKPTLTIVAASGATPAATPTPTPTPTSAPTTTPTTAPNTMPGY